METCFSPFFEEPRPADPLWSIGKYRIVRCRESGLVYLSNPLSNEELEAFYGVEYFEGDESRRGYASYQADEAVLRKNFRELLALVCREVRDANVRSLADYGCAYGYFLDEARARFRDVRGVELNDAVAEIARRRFGLRIDSGKDAEHALEAESLDVVTMWDVIEHLRRPRSTLRTVARALKGGGSLFVMTGDIDSFMARALGRRWRLINPPQHITYFSTATLTRMLEGCGFEVTSVTRFGKHVSLALFLFTAQYLAGSASLRREPGWLARRSLYVNLFDVVCVTARKVV